MATMNPKTWPRNDRTIPLPTSAASILRRWSPSSLNEWRIISAASGGAWLYLMRSSGGGSGPSKYIARWTDTGWLCAGWRLGCVRTCREVRFFLRPIAGDRPCQVCRNHPEVARKRLRVYVCTLRSPLDVGVEYSEYVQDTAHALQEGWDDVPSARWAESRRSRLADRHIAHDCVILSDAAAVNNTFIPSPTESLQHGHPSRLSREPKPRARRPDPSISAIARSRD